MSNVQGIRTKMRKLTIEEAESLLPDGDYISVVETRKPGEVQARRWERETILALIHEHQHNLALAGQLACATGRGLLIKRPSFHPHGNHLHVACKPDRLNELLNEKES
jgi:hypothetical protein